MKLRTLKYTNTHIRMRTGMKQLLITTLILLLPLFSVKASDCERYYCKGEELTNVTNNYFTEQVESAVALSSVIPDLIPEIGNSRVDIAISNYGDGNAIGMTFMHAWDSLGFYEKSNMGASFAKGDGDDGKWLFRVQGGVEW